MAQNTTDGVGNTDADSRKDFLWGLGTEANINSTYADDALRQETGENESASIQGNIAQMLGYGSSLRRHGDDLFTSLTEETLRRTLEEERYFVIVTAYDLKTWKKEVPNKSVWTIRLNISSLGNNFETAMNRMSKAGVDYFGRATGEVCTVKSKESKGHVDLAPLIILGEVK